MTDRLCSRCHHPESALGPRGICVATLTPEALPDAARSCGCLSFVQGEPRAGVCRSCGAGILWWHTRHGRWAPYDLDGTPHFATCPSAHKHRKPKPVAATADGTAPRSRYSGPGAVADGTRGMVRGVR